MKANIHTLYEVEELLESSIVSRDFSIVEQALQILDEIINESEMEMLDNDEDDENSIPDENIDKVS